MGILKTNKPTPNPANSSTKRRSVQTDFANLKPLKPGGTIGFTGIRDEQTRNGKVKNPDDMESDDEEDGDEKFVDADEDFKDHLLSPEDVKKQGELAEGVKKIKVSKPSSPARCH